MMILMRRAAALAESAAGATLTVTLTFDERRKSRRPLRLDSGEEIALHLPRGTVLRGGDCLRLDDGTKIEVRAAPEPLSSVTTADAFLLSRLAYHLGNRHVPLEIQPGCVRYQHDHVLDDMVRGLGVSPEVVHAPFQPEPGAYGGGHRHGHDDDHHHHA